MPASLLGPESRRGVIRIARETDDIVAVRLEGEFDLSNAPTLGEEFDRALSRENDLILDLSDATFIDSNVVNALFRASKAVEGRGRTIVLQLGTEAIVERVLEIAGIESILRRARSRAEAIEMIRRGSSAESHA